MNRYIYIYIYTHIHNYINTNRGERGKEQVDRRHQGSADCRQARETGTSCREKEG